MKKNRRVRRNGLHNQGHEALVKIRLGLLRNGKALIKRPVAGFAVHVRVRALCMGVGNIRVAGLAALVPRKLCRMRGNVAQGCPAIMPILSKTLRDYVAAYHPKYKKCDNKEPRKPEKMSCIFQTAHQMLSPYSSAG